MQLNLTGQVALVTGGTRGIGQAVASALAAEGATVIVSSRTKPEHPQSSSFQSEQIIALQADSRSLPDIEQLVSQIMDRFGHIDILVNNAANIPYAGPTLEADLAAWDASFAANVGSVFAVTKAVVDAWMGTHGGAIVNVASYAGLKASIPGIPGSDLGIYSVTKASVLMLTRVLAKELRPNGVRVNAVAPGVIQTTFSEGLWGTQQQRERLIAEIPSGRLGTANDIAQAVTFLASDAASYINGETLVIDGGTLA